MAGATGLACLHCRAATNGVVLCARCQRTASTALRNVATYHEEMFGIGNITPRVRRRSGASDPIGNAVTADPDRDTPVETAAVALTASLTGWVRVLIDDRPGLAWPRDNVAAMTAFLHEHMRSIAVLEWAGEFMSEVLAFEVRLRRIVSAHQGHWSAGVCGARTGDGPDDWCAAELIVHPGTSYLRCSSCGTHWSVEERRRQVIEQARDMLLPVSLIANIAVALLPEEPSIQRLEARLRKWVERGLLDDYGVRWVAGRPRRVYRVGEVMDRLVRDRSGISA